MTILALDLGGNVGMAFGPVGGPPLLSTLKLEGPVGPMMSRFEGALRGYLRANGVTVIAYEKPMIPFGKPMANNFVKLQRVFGQSAIILKLAHEFGVIPSPHEVLAVRKKFCGSRKAKPDDILRACYAIGVEPSDDHAADACLIWRAANAVATQARAA